MSSPPEGIRVQFQEDNITTIIADIDGPIDTPFQDGTFRCKLTLSNDYPNAPPKGMLYSLFVRRSFSFTLLWTQIEISLTLISIPLASSPILTPSSFCYPFSLNLHLSFSHPEPSLSRYLFNKIIPSQCVKNW